MSSVFGEDPPVYRFDPNQPRPPAPRQQAKLPSGASGTVPGSAVTPSNSMATTTSIVGSLAAQRKNKLVQDVTVRLQALLAAFNQETTAEIDRLVDYTAKLKTGEAAVKQNIAALREQHAVLSARVSSLTSKNSDLDRWLSEHEQKQLTTADVDALVYPADTWSRDMLDAVSDDQAVEDTLYTLDKALASERIDLPNFLKVVRRLASKQFVARALARRIYDRQHEMQVKAYQASF